MHDPELVIMDEPTLGLDPLMQKEFYTFLKEEQQKGKTALVSSHILSEVEKVCDRVGIIKDGTIVTVEDVETLKKKSGKVMEVTFQTPVTKKDLDTPEISDVVINKHMATFTVTGDMDKTIKYLSQFTITDLTAKELSIEDIFMHYYGD
jgi:ABC-2 type transport system ATP-binding protein